MYGEAPSNSAPGMLSVGPNYSYNQQFSQTPMKVTSPQTGAASMAAALVNGYSDYLSRQSGSPAPMQLPGGQTNDIFSAIGNLFTPQATPGVTGDDRITSGLY